MRESAALLVLVALLSACEKAPAPQTTIIFNGAPDSASTPAEQVPPVEQPPVDPLPVEERVVQRPPAVRPPAVTPPERAPSPDRPPRVNPPTQPVIQQPRIEKPPVEEPKRPPVVAPVPAAPTRSVFVRTVPSGAKIRLTANSSGQQFEGTTPITLAVPADIYKWEVELSGYLSDKSVRNDVDVVANKADTVAVTMTPVGDVGALYERAERAYRRAGGTGCEEAVQIYKQLPVPSDVRGAQGIQWMEGQHRAGQCQLRLKEYDDAEAIFTGVLKRSPSQWATKYELARVNCETRQYSKGIQHLRELRGPFPLSADIAPAVRAIAKFGETDCRYRDLQSKDQPDRFPDLRDQVKGGFEEFVEGAEPLLQGAFPADVKKMLQESLTKAKQALQKLDGGN